jgi:hypothetical protein
LQQLNDLMMKSLEPKVPLYWSMFSKVEPKLRGGYARHRQRFALWQRNLVRRCGARACACQPLAGRARADQRRAARQAGAGLDLARMCDIRIASEKAKFAESFVRLGIIPGDGGAWLLPRIVGMSRAAELAFTGDTIDAQQALAWNLVSRVVPHDELMPATRELAGRITRNAAHGLRLTKRLMREAIHARLDTVLELSATFQAISHKTPDHSEAVDAFLEKREPRFD